MRTSQLTLPASQCEQFRRAFISPTRASLRLCRAASNASFASSRYAAIKSIDVEFAHFVNKGQITTAAAEVCLLAEDGSVLLNSYICPGICVRFRSIKASEVSKVLLSPPRCVLLQILMQRHLALTGSVESQLNNTQMHQHSKSSSSSSQPYSKVPFMYNPHVIMTQFNNFSTIPAD